MAVTVQRLTDIDNSIHSLLNNEKIKDAPASDPTKKALQAVDKIVESLLESMKKQAARNQTPSAQQAANTAHDNSSQSTPNASSTKQTKSPNPAAQTSSTSPVNASGGAIRGDSASLSTGADSSNLEGILDELERALKAQEHEQNGKSTGVPAAGDKAPHHGHGHHHTASNSENSRSTGGISAAGGASNARMENHVVAGKSSPDQIMNQGREVGSHNKSYGPELAANKQKILDGLDNASPPATDKEKALVMSMFMQETTHMTAAEGDRSKDANSNGSANFSALNMNTDMMKRVSTFDPAVNLNDDANIGKAASLCLDGLREKGTMSWIAGHRGGGPASDRQDATGSAATPGDANSADYFKQYYDSVATDYQAILKDPTLLKNDMRVENDAKPVYG